MGFFFKGFSASDPELYNRLSVNYWTHWKGAIRMMHIAKTETKGNLESLFQNQGNLKKYQTNEMIFMEDDQEDCLFYIASGLVKLSMISDEGKEKTLFILSQGQFFGEVALGDGLQCDVNAETLTATDIYALGYKQIKELMATDLSIALDLLHIMAEKMRLLTQQVKDMVFSDITGRLASQIITFSQQFGHNIAEGIMIDLILTHQELANLLGASRVTVTKTLNQFQESGIIKIYNRRIVITNLKKLKTYIK